MELTGAFAAVKELQNTLNAIKLFISGISSVVEDYQKMIAPISTALQGIHNFGGSVTFSFSVSDFITLANRFL